MSKKRLGRLAAIIITSVIMLGVCAGRLVNLQVTHGDEYEQKSNRTLLRTSTVKAIRGEILDRYGRPFVTNRECFNLQIDKVSLGSFDLNALILEGGKLLGESGEGIIDPLPITKDGKSFTFDEADGENALSQSAARIRKELSLPENASAPEILDKLRERYKIAESYNDSEARAIASVRYEMESRDFSVSNPVTIASDVSIETVTRIKEGGDRYRGIEVVQEPIRVYTDPTVASHILGRIGSIYKDEYAALKEQGYQLNDLVGKEGAEKAFESYLRGKNGSRTVEQSLTGSILGVSNSVEAVPGNNVLLTLDKNLQQAAEKSLAENIAKIAETAKLRRRKGYDADAGAVVVLDVVTGEALAIANYPGFNLATYNRDYSALLNDPLRPMVNRALSGLYEPGSTFKMLTATAGLESGVIDPSTRITCTGRYEVFAPEYRPRCWIYSDYGITHGTLNDIGAIEKSCNIFFYETGRLMGIEVLNEYGRMFGLGEYTGIELSGESKGVLAGRQNSFERGLPWYGGQTVQAAIGQSDNLFTPVQLANYMATLVNGGTRYNVHLLKSVRDYHTGDSVFEAEPTVALDLGISELTLKTVRDGMKKVTEDGTASSVFANYPIPVGGKTGSAEVPSGSANGVFVAYAPLDNPEIAVAIVVEHGAHGNSVAPIARDIFDAYFAPDTEGGNNIKNHTLFS